AERNRRADRRSPRSHRTHSRSSPARSALPVRCHRYPFARRTGPRMTQNSSPFLVRPLAATVVAATLALGLGGCAPLVVGGAMVGGAMVATDRRSSGAQL